MLDRSVEPVDDAAAGATELPGHEDVEQAAVDHPVVAADEVTALVRRRGGVTDGLQEGRIEWSGRRHGLWHRRVAGQHRGGRCGRGS